MNEPYKFPDEVDELPQAAEANEEEIEIEIIDDTP